jgi:PEP-CTERM motif
MKKVLLAAVACCVMGAPSMFGASFFEFCPAFPNAFPGGAGGPVNSTCAAFSALPPLSVVTSIEAWDEADYQFGVTGLNSVSITFTPSTTLTTWTTPTVTCTVTGAGNSVANTCGFFSGNLTAPGTTFESANGNLAALAAAGFTVASTSAVNFGAVGQSASGVIAEFDYVSSVPEPGSMMLLGSGLVAFAIAGRKLVRK